MLDELKRLNYPGRKEDLLYFLQSIVGNNIVMLDDIRVLCTHAPAGFQLSADSLVAYCTSFGWVIQDEGISACDEIRAVLNDNVRLNYYMVESTLKTLFDKKILTADMFIYDIDKCQVSFRNELLPLSYASIRNVLISQEFLIIERAAHKTVFWVHPDFEKVLAQFCKKSSHTLTLEQLKSRLEANSIAGAKAESFVLEYEKRRIDNPALQRKIKLISEVDVCAGYDIVSYESNTSTSYDRFIEVKAISRNQSFFWSKNELEIAKLQGEKYFLYLVDLSRIADKEYRPEMISNPALSIMSSSDWLVEPESYHIQRV